MQWVSIYNANNEKIFLQIAHQNPWAKLESKQAYYIDKLINEIATRRIKEALESHQNALMKIKSRRKKR